jgi:16S rRNA (cytidine1402-2'-O)-methyltransferase
MKPLAPPDKTSASVAKHSRPTSKPISHEAIPTDQPGNTPPAAADEGRGRLILVPAPLDFGCVQQAPLRDVMPESTLHIAAGLRHWICENAKSTRAYLKRVDAITPLQHPLQELQLQELPREVHKKGDHHEGFDARPLLAPALAGHDIGLVSEAGMPAIADPGSSVVRAAHALAITVVPLVGPVSLLLTLAASGLNGQNFAFVGYLPQDPAARTKRIRELEKLALSTGQTQLFIETPYRNAAMAQALLQTLSPETRLVMASGLTLSSSQIRCTSTRLWRDSGLRPDNKTPTVFAIGR